MRVGGEFSGDRVDDFHVLNLRRQLTASTASTPRAAPHVSAPDVQQLVLGMLTNVGERALADERDRVGIGDAQVAARDSNAVLAGRKIFGMLGEAIAGQQKLQDVAAVLDADSVLAQQRRDLVDLESRVVRVADVGKRVDAAPRHPRDEFAVVAQMQLEAVGEVVVPGHDVRDESAVPEGGHDAPWFERGESCRIDSRIQGHDARWKLCAELFEQIRLSMDQSALGPGANQYRFCAARDIETVTFEAD